MSASTDPPSRTWHVADRGVVMHARGLGVVIDGLTVSAERVVVAGHGEAADLEKRHPQWDADVRGWVALRRVSPAAAGGMPDMPGTVLVEAWPEIEIDGCPCTITDVSVARR